MSIRLDDLQNGYKIWQDPDLFCYGIDAVLLSHFAVMFLAIIVPPTRKNRVIAFLIPICFISSFLMARLPVVSGISAGTRTIILTVVIAGIAALFFPVKEDDFEETPEKEAGNDS